MTTIDVLALLVLALAFIGVYLWWMRKVIRILNDPSHPDHETAKEAIKESETRQTLDWWFR